LLFNPINKEMIKTRSRFLSVVFVGIFIVLASISLARNVSKKPSTALVEETVERCAIGARWVETVGMILKDYPKSKLSRKVLLDIERTVMDLSDLTELARCSPSFRIGKENLLEVLRDRIVNTANSEVFSASTISHVEVDLSSLL
jgi:hypothetical protein